MKTKKILLGMMGVAVSCFFMASSAAAMDWSACKANKIGTYGDEVRIQVTGCVGDTTTPAGAGKDGWMILNPTGTDQQMASVLTAISLGKNVGIGQDGSTKSGYVIVQSLMLKN